MQGHKDRLTKQELREDEFVSRILGILDYSKENYPKIIAGVGALAVIVLIGVFINRQAEQRRLEAVDAMGDVRISLLKGEEESAINQAQQVAQRYSGKPAARNALLVAGNLQFENGRFAEARTTFENYLDNFGSEGPLGYGAWVGTAASLEEEGNLNGAAERYVAYVDKHSDTPFAPLALKEAARCYEFSGALEKAKTTLQRIVDEYAKSPAANVAKAKLAQMGAAS
ncbi:MAG: tetratricopeptide repeat protein [bacterium]|nr:tetratricopeptide repeat protein [bacterium]